MDMPDGPPLACAGRPAGLTPTPPQKGNSDMFELIQRLFEACDNYERMPMDLTSCDLWAARKALDEGWLKQTGDRMPAKELLHYHHIMRDARRAVRRNWKAGASTQFPDTEWQAMGEISRV